MGEVCLPVRCNASIGEWRPSRTAPDTHMDWKKYIAEACILFTVLCLLILLINWMIAGTLEGVAVEPVWFFRILLLSFVCALARRIRLIEKIPGWARLLIHAILIVFGIFFILVLPYSLGRNYAVSTILVILLVLSMVYAALYAICYLFARLSKKKSGGKEPDKNKKDKPAYTKQFHK